jgi:hypothetical protein
MCRTPEPIFPISRRLQAEEPLVPKGIMNEADVLDLEFELLPPPFHFPGEVRFLELLPESGKFDPIRRREENLEANRIANHRVIPSDPYSTDR